MRYGFALDQRTCIGCHACTVACKTEHEIPLGQFRTWVKYVEKGEYPSTTREFGVMRCNHCTDAPCVKICPTKSLFKRDDGIVDFDSERCIGCKSCMQACPYDAIYIDEDTHTAAKCNFCAHRVDEGLEPACVVVCPTQSIWVGDLDDPGSAISQLAAANETAVRAPEQRTGPNVFYLGADRAVLDPLAAPVQGTYLWAKPDPHRQQVAADLAVDGMGDGTYTSLNTAHPPAWGWRVYTYLWTKALGAGALIVAAFALLVGVDLGVLGNVVAPALGFAFTAATGALLVADLKRPERFLYLFLKPNPTSWLFWGGLALSAYSGLALLWLGAGALDRHSVIAWLAAPAALAGALTAGYTGFLFAQAEGRDLWQSRLLLWQLLAQAVMAGSGALLIAAPLTGLGAGGSRLLGAALAGGTVADLVLLAVEYGHHRPTRNGAAAARMVVRGRYAKQFWIVGVGVAAVAGVLGLGVAAGLAVTVLGVIAGLLVQVALLVYESVFVRAGQDVPLS